MKNKYLFIKIFGIVFLVFIIFAYFLFYFIPSIETINRHKRELKDMSYKIQNFLDMEKEFSFTNRREQDIFKAVDDGLKGLCPEIESKEDFIRLFTGVFDYIKQRARSDGIFNLVLTSNSKEPGLNDTSLHTDKRSLDRLQNFAAARMNEIREKTAASRDISGSSPLLAGLDYQTVFLSFSGPLENAVTFINHLPWSDYYLRPADILVSAGDSDPYYMVFLNVYFIDTRTKDVKQ